jgi:hypothetical protein
MKLSWSAALFASLLSVSCGSTDPAGGSDGGTPSESGATDAAGTDDAGFPNPGDDSSPEGSTSGAGTPEAGAPIDGGNEASAPDSGHAPDASSTPEAGAGLSCGSTGDCRIFSSTCGSCTCLALRAGQDDPPCNKTQVNCLIDPCSDKSPSCDHGQCVVASPPP